VNALLVLDAQMQIDDDATGEVYPDIEVVWNELGDVQQGEFINQSGHNQEGEFYFGGATGGGVSDRYK
jgi:hypothetical protein